MTSAIGVALAGRPPLVPMRASVLLFAAVVVLSAAIVGAGKWFGHTVALGGHSDDQTVHEILIGNNVIEVPANAIRFNKDRRSGTTERLELYLHWPDLEGYSSENSAAFNNLSKNGNIVFLTFEPRMMSRDMSGRFEPIYRVLVEQPGRPGPGDITFYAFTSRSGYVDEQLAVANRAGKTPFVARCLRGEQARHILAECQQDILLSDDLSLTYRFPMSLLGNWRAMDDTILERAHQMLRTGVSVSER